MTLACSYPSPLPVIVLPLSAVAIYARYSDRKLHALLEAAARAPTRRKRSTPRNGSTRGKGSAR